MKKLIIAILLLFIVTTSIYATLDENNAKTVRVGYMIINNFQEGEEGEYKSGYGYEYLQLISNYTGWNYEYVYGSFSDLFQKLVAGEIDIMGYVSYTKERYELINYARLPEGKESIYIYISPDSKTHLSSDGLLPNGSKIGVIDNYTFEKVLEKWIKDQNKDYTIKRYKTDAELHRAIDSGAVEGIISSDFASHNDYVPIYHMGFENFYFGVSKERKDLLDELNYALNEILRNTRYVNTTLYNKYYGKIKENTNLNHNDLAWLEKNDNTIKMGYLKNNLPYSDQDEKGDLVGIMGKLVEVFEQEYEIDIDLYPFDSQKEVMQALHTDQINVYGPLFSDYFLAEEHNILNTNSLLSTTVVMLHLNPNIDDSNLKIAYTKNNAIQFGLTKVLYPESTMVSYPDNKSCLAAVKNKEVNCTLIPTASINMYKQYEEFSALNVTEINRDINICLGIQKRQISLLNLLNRVIIASKGRLTGATFIENATIEPTFIDFLKNHVITVTMVLITIIVILTSLIIYVLFNKTVIHRMQNANARLAIKAFRDELTSVGNRAAYLAEMDEINELILQNICPQFAILVIDINALKVINDNFGHEVGDILIKNVSKTVCTIFKHSPVYRIGGDEFVVVLKDDSYKSRDYLTTQLNSTSSFALTKSSVMEGKYSISWGLSDYNKGTDHTFKDVFKKADHNMYIKKKKIKQQLEIFF